MRSVARFTIIITCSILFIGSLESRAIAVPRAGRDTASTGITTAQETAIRTIGIGGFARLSSEQSNQLAQKIESELNLKSYLKASNVVSLMGSVKPNRMGPDEAKQIGTRAHVDGLLIGLIKNNKAQFQIIAGTTGRVLFKTTVSAPSADQLADAIIEKLLQSMPFRGFVTKTLSGGRYEINLGSQHGMVKGMRLSAFEFSNLPADYTSERVSQGDLEVIEVGQETSTVQTTNGSNDIEMFAKISTEESSRGMAPIKVHVTSKWLSVGGEFLSVDAASVEPQNDLKAYRLSNTAAFALGFGTDIYALRGFIGQVRNDQYQVTLSELNFAARVRNWQLSSKSDLGMQLGIRYSRFGSVAATGIVGSVESFSRLSPLLGLHYEFRPRSRLALLGGAQILYPISYSGGGSASPFSVFGYGANVGFAIELTSHLAVDFGWRYQSVGRPITGQTSLARETQSSVLADLVVHF